MVVTLYSGGDLTFVKDRLVAISGVAKWVSEQTADVYLAGLWERDLPKQLLWFRKRRSNTDDADAKEDPQTDVTNPTEYLAPSWSWGSVYTSIQFPEEDDAIDVRVDIVHCYTIPLDHENPFGQIVGGELRIAFTRIYCYTPEDGIRMYNAQGSVSDLHTRRPKSGPLVIWDIPGQRIKLEPVYLLPVLKEQSSVNEYLKGIALVYRVASQKFKRIGYWESASKPLRSALYNGRSEFELLGGSGFSVKRALTII